MKNQENPPKSFPTKFQQRSWFMRWKLFSFFIVHLFTFLVFFSFVNVNKILDSYVFCFCLLNSFLRWSSFLLVALVWNIMLLLLLFLFFLKFSRGLCFRNFDRCWYCFFFFFFVLVCFVFSVHFCVRKGSHTKDEPSTVTSSNPSAADQNGGSHLRWWKYVPILYCTVLYKTELYCTVMCCTVLLCTVLYCIFLSLHEKKNVLRDRQPKW